VLLDNLTNAALLQVLKLALLQMQYDLRTSAELLLIGDRANGERAAGG